MLTRIGIVDDGAYGYRQRNTCAVAAGALATFTVAATLGIVLGVEPEMQEGVVVVAGFEKYIAAVTSISSAGPPARNEFFAPERKATIPAVAGFHGDDYFVYKHFSNKKGAQEAPLHYRR